MAQALDKQIQHYWPLLGDDEKKSILGVIRSFVSLHEEKVSRTSLEHYNKETDEALARVKEGAKCSQDEVEKMAAEW